MDSIDLPFQIGALYRRRAEIHAALGGQEQGGISTPSGRPVVIAFTGEAGEAHGYSDFWDDEGHFHYYGEGQSGDMTFTGGNRAIQNHLADHKTLILFQMMGKGQPCRYWGEFVLISSYLKPNTQATRGPVRTAIVFKLKPLDEGVFALRDGVSEPTAQDVALGSTVTLQLVEVRKTQSLFRRRLVGIEKACRLTEIRDLRFLRASHIKPWSECEKGGERTDGNNGLLLTPHADLLFDRGWIGFEDAGQLIVANDLPSDVIKRIGLNLKPGRRCGTFWQAQKPYLDYHRSNVFEQKYKKLRDPVEDLFAEVSALK
jgi:5-methylcytosine-specific restriction enzyme A